MTILLPLDLVSLLYHAAVLLLLGTSHLPNAGLSAWHMGSVPSDILAAAPLNHHSGATLGVLPCDSVGQAYVQSRTEVGMGSGMS